MIRITEVGPRDGLQNDPTKLSVAERVELAGRLTQAGIRRLELGAFVSAEWVPQMENSGEVIAECLKLQAQGQIPKQTSFSALVPNERGMQDALKSGVKEIAIFASATESFSQKNLNCSIEESFRRFELVIKLAKRNKVRVRGYLSMCFGCPFEGKVSETRVVQLTKRLVKIGAYEVSVGDTLGVANPKQVRSLVSKLKKAVGAKRIALHFHDTRGTALANILAGLDLGVETFDSSVGGLGGCPYAPSALGNVATEDVIFMLHGMGLKTGIDLAKLIEVSRWLAGKVGHALPSRVAAARLWNP